MLEIMASDPEITIGDIALSLGVSKVYVSKMIRNSKERGVLTRDESVRRGGWHVDVDLLGRL